LKAFVVGSPVILGETTKIVKGAWPRKINDMKTTFQEKRMMMWNLFPSIHKEKRKFNNCYIDA
jgi:hypothetical protein